MGQGFRLFECPQSEIMDKVQMKPLGRERSLAIQTRESSFAQYVRFIKLFLSHVCLFHSLYTE